MAEMAWAVAGLGGHTALDPLFSCFGLLLGHLCHLLKSAKCLVVLKGLINILQLVSSVLFGIQI